MADYPIDLSVADLKKRAAENLRTARGNTKALRSAILDYLEAGSRMGLTPSELTDFFCVSTPNILESAGFADAAGDDVVTIFDDINNELRNAEK